MRLSLTPSLLSGDVKTASSLTAEAGRPVLLSCNISLASGEDVRQVRWLNRHKVPVLTYQPPAHVSHSLAHVELVPSRQNASAITIMRLRPDDAGCYRCIFDIYPSGSQEGSTCITVVGWFHKQSPLCVCVRFSSLSDRSQTVFPLSRTSEGGAAIQKQPSQLSFLLLSNVSRVFLSAPDSSIASRAATTNRLLK